MLSKHVFGVIVGLLLIASLGTYKLREIQQRTVLLERQLQLSTTAACPPCPRKQACPPTPACPPNITVEPPTAEVCEKILGPRATPSLPQQAPVTTSNNLADGHLFPDDLKANQFHVFATGGIVIETPDSVKVDSKILVVIASGEESADIVNEVIDEWKFDRFDFVLFTYDTHNWSQYEWYPRVITIAAMHQMKFWFYKRFLHPDFVASYARMIVIDGDTGGLGKKKQYEETEKTATFDLSKFLELVNRFDFPIAGPCYSGGTHSVATNPRTTELGRWTDVVEVGPLFAITPKAWRCVYPFIHDKATCGFGLDLHWCYLLSEVCGYTPQKTCAILDPHQIIHLNRKSSRKLETPYGKINDQGNREVAAFEKMLTAHFPTLKQRYWWEAATSYGNITTA